MQNDPESRAVPPAADSAHAGRKDDKVSVMTTRASEATPTGFTEQAITDHLDRISSSKAFRQADRLKRFLTFIVNEAIAGRGERLKEFVVGIEVFGKDTLFDPRSDPIVRVQARRLRAQLARYYREEGQGDELIVELPKGGYAPIFRNSKVVSPRKSLASALVSRNTVAVTPFADYTRTGDQQYFCAGLVQEIIQNISGLNTVRLVLWPKTAPFDREEDLRRAVEELGVSLLICGGVRASGGERRITTHLLDAVSGSYLWSESIDGTDTDDIRMQKEVANGIANRIREGLTSGTHPRTSGVTAGNLAACNLCVQARYHLSQRTEDSLRKAADLFERATAEDAQYAPAYSGLADAWGLLAHYGAVAPASAWTKAASNAAWAVLMNDNSAEAHTSFAHVKATQDWDWTTAEREYRRAIDLDPRYPTARHWYAISALVPQGRLDEALSEMLLAQELDPISSIIARDIAMTHYYRRDYEAALEQCDHTIGLNPYFAPAYWMLGLIQEQIGDLDESAAALQRAALLSPQSLRMQASLCRLFALSGREREARSVLKQIRSQSEKRYVSPFDLATIYFGLGQINEGFEWLNNAVTDRCFALTSLHLDPRFDVVRRDPRFVALIGQVGLDKIGGE